MDKLWYLATGYVVVKATEQQGGFVENGVITKFGEVVQNYCGDVGRWKRSIEDVSKMIFYGEEGGIFGFSIKS